MKRVAIFLMLFLGLWINFSHGDENLALLEKGGRVVYLDGNITYNKPEDAFDGVGTGTSFQFDIVRGVPESKPSLDRIWDKKVKIEQIGFKTTGAGRSYEYQFLYWDLDERVWKEIVYVAGNQDMSPSHKLKEPIITNKIRYKALKVGSDGTSNYNHVYEIYYYGQFLDTTVMLPNNPANAGVERISDSSAQLIWSDPGPKGNAWIAGFRIYRGSTPDFLPSIQNLIVNENELTTDDGTKYFSWVDTKCSIEATYYKIVSIGDFGQESPPINLAIPEVLNTENISLLKYGGEAILVESIVRQGNVESAFGGENPSGRVFGFEIVRLPAGSKPCVDRVWEQKVKIDRIHLRTTSNERPYEYRFSYWDLTQREWKVIIYKNENSSSNRTHYLPAPIITNKIRYEVIRCGVTGTGNVTYAYELNYFGKIIADIPPNEPLNCVVTVHPAGFLQVSWETPLPNNDGELPVSYNIYRGNREIFIPSKENLVAKDIRGNVWVDITTKSEDDIYYLVESVSEFGSKSNYATAKRME